MYQVQFLTVLQKTLILILELSAPVLIVSLVVGLLISVFQSVTQIQESTLTFVPKIIAAFLTIIFLAPWMLQLYVSAINEMFSTIPTFMR